MNISLEVLTIIIILTSILTVFVIGLVKNKFIRLTIIAHNLGFLIYSGIGISMSNVRDSYVYYYFIYMLVFSVVSVILDNSIKGNKQKVNINPKLVSVFAIVYFMCLLFPLLYPTIRLGNLFNFDISLIDIFEKQLSYRDNPFTYIASLIATLTFPFYFISIGRLKLKYIVGLTILTVWIQQANLGYISRSSIFSLFIFVVLLVFSNYFNTNRSLLNIRLNIRKTSFILTIIIMTLIMLPILYDFTYTRVGLPIPQTGYFDKVFSLFESEIDYPKYYDLITLSHLPEYSGGFIKWLLTLPIPKQIFDINNILEVNKEFTFIVTGRLPGDPGYYVVLPSTLGESLLIFGPDLFFLHSILFALIIVLIVKVYDKVSYTKVYILYLISLVLLTPRGGVQGTIAFIINSSLLYVLIFILTLIFNGINSKGVKNETASIN